MGQGKLGTIPTKNPTRKCGIILFFIFFEGIHELQTRKEQKSAFFTLVTHRWKQKCCFLDDFDVGGWDLNL
jgi:hypothetical protein